MTQITVKIHTATINITVSNIDTYKIDLKVCDFTIMLLIK